jgi:hypothetical protein
MWKEKPVIGGDTGRIRIQVVIHHTGFLVNTPKKNQRTARAGPLQPLIRASI